MAKSKQVSEPVSTDYFPSEPIPKSLERINYIATSRDDIDHRGLVPTPGHDIPIMRVRGGVGRCETKKAKDGREYNVLHGTFVVTPCDGGPEFTPLASSKFIPPDCVAGEIGFAGCPVDMVIVKRFWDKSPTKYTFVVLYSPRMDEAVSMTGDLNKALSALAPAEPVKALKA